MIIQVRVVGKQNIASAYLELSIFSMLGSQQVLSDHQSLSPRDGVINMGHNILLFQ